MKDQSNKTAATNTFNPNSKLVAPNSAPSSLGIVKSIGKNEGTVQFPQMGLNFSP